MQSTLHALVAALLLGQVAAAAGVRGLQAAAATPSLPKTALSSAEVVTAPPRRTTAKPTQTPGPPAAGAATRTAISTSDTVTAPPRVASAPKAALPANTVQAPVAGSAPPAANVTTLNATSAHVTPAQATGATIATAVTNSTNSTQASIAASAAKPDTNATSTLPASVSAGSAPAGLLATNAVTQPLVPLYAIDNITDGSPQTSTSLTQPAAENRILVQFNTPSPNATAPNAVPEDIMDDTDVNATNYLPISKTYVLEVAPELDTISKVLELRDRDDVAFASPDFQVNVQYADGTSSTSYNLYGLDTIDAPCLWNQLDTGTNTTAVCVIDSGVQTNHPDLAANLWRNPFEIPGNGIDDDGNGCIDDILGCGFINGSQVSVFDDNSHGTHVAGTIGAVKNGFGISGVNQRVAIMACKFLDADGVGYNSDALSCFNWCKTNFAHIGQAVPIYSNSWGCLDCYDPTVYNGLLNTTGLQIFAAGNNGVFTDSSDPTQQFFPADYGLPNQISVGATDNLDNPAPYSNYGPQTVNLFAPGSNIISLIPNNTFAYKSGTSMATPHVAGAAALIANAFPSASAAALKSSMLASVNVTGTLAGYCGTQGRLNVYNQSVTLQRAPYNIKPAGNLPRDTTAPCTAATRTAATVTPRG